MAQLGLDGSPAAWLSDYTLFSPFGHLFSGSTGAHMVGLQRVEAGIYVKCLSQSSARNKRADSVTFIITSVSGLVSQYSRPTLPGALQSNLILCS